MEALAANCHLLDLSSIHLEPIETLVQSVLGCSCGPQKYTVLQEQLSPVIRVHCMMVLDVNKMKAMLHKHFVKHRGKIFVVLSPKKAKNIFVTFAIILI